ncbi:MAG: hypothetical protein LC744_04305 [Chloroflexi bacterium]|nr:hypothetical protein [Chloroflexota bacterium]
MQARYRIGLRDPRQVQACVRLEQEGNVVLDRIGEAGGQRGGDAGRIGLQKAFEGQARRAGIGGMGQRQKMLLRAAFRSSRE